MTLFQFVMIPLLAALSIHAMLMTVLGRGRILHAIKATTWLTGAILVCFPNALTRAALAAGIGRGADLMFYFVIVAATWSFFHLKARQWMHDEALTRIVQQHAIDNAEEIPMQDLP